MGAEPTRPIAALPWLSLLTAMDTAEATNGRQISLPDGKDPEDFVGRILRGKCYPPDEVSGFLPYCALTETLTREVIQVVLKQNGAYAEKLEDMVGRILDTNPDRCMMKIFAILVLTDMTAFMPKFIEFGISDKDLPLPPGSELYSCLHFLRQSQADNFYNYLWLVDVPLLDLAASEIEAVKYRSDVRMPFLKEQLRAGGGQGRINEIKIHPGHVRGLPSSSSDYVFALKRMSISSDSRLRWKDEIAALNGFRDPRSGHPNVIKLLLAYEHEGKGLYLVFPLAKGDLNDYWRQHHKHSPLFEDALWLIQQCTDLTSALRKIHYHTSFPEKSCGRHGDIKPGNILWFQGEAGDGRGRLVVADLTMTRFHSDDTVNDTTFSGRGMSMTYRAPEVNVTIGEKESQAYDIWSLGCMFLEFMVWYHLGYHALGHPTDVKAKQTNKTTCNKDHYLNERGEECQSFKRARINDDDWWYGEDKFFNVSRDGCTAEVKASWAQRLHTSALCSQAMHDFLDLIMTQMLVIEPKERANMAQVNNNLRDILEECSRVEYCHHGAAYQTSTNDDAPLKFEKNPQKGSSTDLPLSCPSCCEHRHEETETDKKVEDLFSNIDEGEGMSTDVGDLRLTQLSFEDSEAAVQNWLAVTSTRDDDDKEDDNDRNIQSSPQSNDEHSASDTPSPLDESDRYCESPAEDIACEGGLPFPPVLGAADVRSPGLHERPRLLVGHPTATIVTSYLQARSEASSARRPRSPTTMSQESCDSLYQDEELRLPGVHFPGVDCEVQRSNLEDNSVFDEPVDGSGVDREEIQSGGIVAAPDGRLERFSPIEETTQDIRGVLNEKPPITIRLVRYYRRSKLRIKTRLHSIKAIIWM
ncbi:kinase-like domain-containing protein [Xylaria flabelliformis]|nr:kinase-like domain-containing protein [Xylaria flabelliformis]